MTKCNWKTGLALFFGALFLASPCLAEISNSLVESDVNSFVKQSLPANATELSNKQDAINKEYDTAKLEWKNAKDELKKKIYDFRGHYESVWRRIGTWLDYQYETKIEAMFSGDANDYEDYKKMVNYYIMKGRSYLSEEGNSQKMAEFEKEAGELQQLLDKTKPFLDRFREAKNNKNSLGDLSGDVRVYTDQYGNEIYFKVSADNTIETVLGATRGCTPLPAKLAEAKSCLFCPLFKKIFNAAQVMTTNSFYATSNALSIVLVIGFGIWLAFKIMVLVSSFTKQDGPKFVSEALTQAFKVLVAYLLLKNASFVYTQLLGPLLKAGMEFGMAMLFEKGSSYLNACNETKALQNLNGGLLPTYLYTQLECYIQAIQAEISVPQAIGSSLMCVSLHAAKQDLDFILTIENVIPDFSMLIEGLIIWLLPGCFHWHLLSICWMPLFVWESSAH